MLKQKTGYIKTKSVVDGTTGKVTTHYREASLMGWLGFKGLQHTHNDAKGIVVAPSVEATAPVTFASRVSSFFTPGKKGGYLKHGINQRQANGTVITTHVHNLTGEELTVTHDNDKGLSGITIQASK